MKMEGESVGGLKLIAIKALMFIGVYPSVFFLFRPLKMFEFEHLLGDVSFSGHETVLDLGCGSGVQAALISKRCQKVVGIDVSPGAIASAERKFGRMIRKGRLVFRQSRLEEAGFSSGCFDKVFSFCVIEHIRNYREVIRESYRILKPGGEFVFSVDSLECIEDVVLREKHRKEHSVEKYFREEELRATLEEAGFQKIMIRPILMSDYARKIFMAGVKSEFRKGNMFFILKYLRLRREEKACSRRDKGIFLMARCCR